MARDRITTSQPNSITSWCRASAIVALIAGLSLLSGTRAFDALRAASFFVRTRKGPVVSLLRLDQENEIRFVSTFRAAARN